jgi:hypothetical protein
MYHQSGWEGARCVWTPVRAKLAQGGGATAFRVFNSLATRGSKAEAGTSTGWVMEGATTQQCYLTASGS